MIKLDRWNPVPGMAPPFLIGGCLWFGAAGLALLYPSLIAFGFLTVLGMLCLVIVALERVRGAILLLVDAEPPQPPPAMRRTRKQSGLKNNKMAPINEA